MLELRVMSARQFRNPDFVENVLATLNRTGAKPQNLIVAKMTKLKSHGLTHDFDFTDYALPGL
jgi:hypothetical protein